MASEIKAKVGTKMSEAEQKALDKSKVGKIQGAHPKGEVEAEYSAFQICPYCGCGGWGSESTYVYLYFTCHCCGQTFKA